MSEQTYEVVFGGDLVPGANKDRVVENLAALFKTSNDKITRLFSGGEVILKSNLDEPTAQRYQQTLHKAGAVCQVRPRKPVTDSSTDQQKVTPAETPSQPAAETNVQAASSPIAASSTESAVATVNDTGEMVIDPPGVTIITPSEKSELEVDTSAYSLAPVGSDVLEGEKQESPPPPDTSELSLAPVGTDILEKEREEN